VALHDDTATAHEWAHAVFTPRQGAGRRQFDQRHDLLQLAREILAQQAFDPYRGSELAPGPEVRSAAQIDAYIRAHGEAFYHSVGTCSMGADDMAVVDRELRVHGITALRVVDASIMPRIISGNMNMPVIMIAEKAADLILNGDQT
jgi:choline dehydrogenase